MGFNQTRPNLRNVIERVSTFRIKNHLETLSNTHDELILKASEETKAYAVSLLRELFEAWKMETLRPCAECPIFEDGRLQFCLRCQTVREFLGGLYGL